MAELRFDGRVAIVTGAGRGVGRGHALLLASRGARVVVADYGGTLEGDGSSKGPAEEVVSEIKAAGGEAVSFYGSVADEKDASHLVEAAVDTFGKLDIVINNAGISDPELLDDLTIAQFRKMIDVHYYGTVFVVKAAWKHLKANGYGRVVNTASEGMFGNFPMGTSYGGSKAAVFGLTRTLAAEGPAYGILVNAIAPRARTRLGSEESSMKVFNRPRITGPSFLDKLLPECVAPPVAYLAHESCKLNGEYLAAGAGQVQRIITQWTKGIASDNLTPEFVAENLDALMDTSELTIIPINAEIHKKAVAEGKS